MQFSRFRNSGIRARQGAPETPGAGAATAGPNSIPDPTAGEPPIGQSDAELAAEIRDLAMEPYGPIKREITKAQDALIKKIEAARGELGPDPTAPDYGALNEMRLERWELSQMAGEVPEIVANAGKAPAGRDFRDLSPDEQEPVSKFTGDNRWAPSWLKPMEVSFQDFARDPVAQIADPLVRQATAALYENFPTRSARLNVLLETHTYLTFRYWENDDGYLAGQAGNKAWQEITDLVRQGAAGGGG